MKVHWIKFSFISMLAFGCATPYLGETVITPITDEAKPYAVQGSWNYAMFQSSVNKYALLGGQLNFPRNSDFLDSNYFVKSSFTGIRLYAGLQSDYNRLHHQAYILGGLGAGAINYREYNSNTMKIVAPDSLIVSYKSTFQSIFVEGGFKLNKGFIGLGRKDRLWRIEIDAPTCYLLHFGAKLVYFNTPRVVNHDLSSNRKTGSPVFEFDKKVPHTFSPSYQFGLSWMYSGETLNILSDVTCHLGDPMYQNFVFRLGLGFRF